MTKTVVPLEPAPGRREHRVWTERDQQRLRRLVEGRVHDGRVSGVVLQEVARQLGRTSAAVYTRLLAMNLIRRVAPRWSADEIQLLRECVAGGVSDKDAADLLGRSVSSVVSKRHQLALGGPAKSVSRPNALTRFWLWWHRRR